MPEGFVSETIWRRDRFGLPVGSTHLMKRSITASFLDKVMVVIYSSLMDPRLDILAACRKKFALYRRVECINVMRALRFVALPAYSNIYIV